MKAYQVGLLVQHDPLRLAIVLDNGEGCTAAEAILTPEQASSLANALLMEAARERVKTENASAEVNELSALYSKSAAAGAPDGLNE